jgi:hypothetical protein
MKATIEERTEIVNISGEYCVVIKSNDEYTKDTYLKGYFKSIKGAEKKRESFLKSYSIR